MTQNKQQTFEQKLATLSDDEVNKMLREIMSSAKTTVPSPNKDVVLDLTHGAKPNTVKSMSAKELLDKFEAMYKKK